MRKIPFYILDVFSAEKYAGNQLAVFRHAAGISSAEMQQIAREINFSETTFVLSDEPRNGGYDVRIFTPNEEVPFAGHPTLGTAHIIRTEILDGQVERLTLNLQVGQIPVSFNPDGNAWMEQVQPQFGAQHPPEALAGILNLPVAEIDARFPIEEVSTGLPFFIVPLKTLIGVQQARVNVDKCLAYIQNTAAKGILVFAPEERRHNSDLRVRVFVHYYGVPEDPATGSGNGCLAGWLVRHRYWRTPGIDLRSRQGVEMGRPSLLLLRASQETGRIRIAVGGQSVLVATGELR